MGGIDRVVPLRSIPPMTSWSAHHPPFSDGVC